MLVFAEHACMPYTESLRGVCVTCYRTYLMHVEVVLTQDIQGVGAKGQVKQVALGFFRNFLLPNGATKATSSVLE